MSKMKSFPWEKVIWGLLIIILMVAINYIFFNSRYIPTSQTFGPIPPSSLGGNIPFNAIDIIKFSCQPNDSYFSEDADLSCKFLINITNEDNFKFAITAKIYSLQNNQTSWNCTSTFSGNGSFDCKDDLGNTFFELPAGDYKISASEFTASGGPVVVTVEKAKEVTFRGTLHIMSTYEKANKQANDGISLATFLAFLFIIPTAVIEIRRFLYEK